RGREDETYFYPRLKSAGYVDLLLSVFFSPGTAATVTRICADVFSGGVRLSFSSAVAFAPLAIDGTFAVSVIGELLSDSIRSVTLTLNSSLSPWLVNATKKTIPGWYVIWFGTPGWSVWSPTDVAVRPVPCRPGPVG